MLAVISNRNFKNTAGTLKHTHHHYTRMSLNPGNNNYGFVNYIYKFIQINVADNFHTLIRSDDLVVCYLLDLIVIWELDCPACLPTEVADLK